MKPLNLAIIDNAFDADLCRAAADAWPDADWPGWSAVYQQDYQKKRAANRWEEMPEPCRELLTQMVFGDVSRMGLGELIPDTMLWGGGMHDLGRDGVLGLHLDASHHKLAGWDRRLNGILFITPEWEAGWGGELELWNENKTRPTVTVSPVFNRLVLFATSDTSWHGIPQPLRCPAEVRRKTLACWWYARPTREKKRGQAHFADAQV